MKDNYSLKPVRTAEDFKLLKEIFLEYYRFLGIDLSFQNFSDELRSLPKLYSHPSGAAMLAVSVNTIAGCVSLRHFSGSICEMKRLYVKPEYQGQGIGQDLISALISRAKILGYDQMRLDTLPNMKRAIELYKRYGFKEISPYRFNPVQGSRFFELNL